MSIGSGVLLPGVVENPPFPILRPYWLIQQVWATAQPVINLPSVVLQTKIEKSEQKFRLHAELLKRFVYFASVLIYSVSTIMFGE